MYMHIYIHCLISLYDYLPKGESTAGNTYEVQNNRSKRYTQISYYSMYRQHTTILHFSICISTPRPRCKQHLLHFIIIYIA